MADFTRTNLLELDDAAAGRAAPLQARMARAALETTDVGVSLFHYGPNFRSPYGHRHRVQEEVYVIAEGSGRMRVNDAVVDLRTWDAVRVAPSAVRTIEAGPDGLTILVVGGPRPPEGDGELLPDDVWIDED